MYDSKKQVFVYFRAFGPARTWNVSHGFSHTNYVVQCFSDTFETMFPNTIERKDKYIEATFPVDTKGFFTVLEISRPVFRWKKFTFTDITNTTFKHNLGTNHLIVQCWNSDNVLIMPDQIQIDSTNITLNFLGSSFSGEVVVCASYPSFKQWDIVIDRFNGSFGPVPWGHIISQERREDNSVVIASKERFIGSDKISKLDIDFDGSSVMSHLELISGGKRI